MNIPPFNSPFTPVSVNLGVDIFVQDHQLHGTCTRLSLSGLHIELNDAPPRGALAIVYILLDDQHKAMIEASTQVTAVGDHGAELRFLDTSLDDFKRLIDLLMVCGIPPRTMASELAVKLTSPLHTHACL